MKTIEEYKASLAQYINDNPEITNDEILAVIDFLEWSTPKPRILS